ncbi:GmrSD restriction endonuclease domain-containing protein [Paraoerskovia sediminicola]|uniref:GmrSD restriction endonuclease domain-containing protein n=1 Tax=Paraoerskovia sediminicola TaxID=1138587 RepID=UPI003306608D
MSDDAAAAEASAAPSASPTSSGDPTPSASATPSATPDPEPSATETPEEEPPSDDAEKASPGTALAAIATLAVKGRAPKTGYDRDEFGPAWADVDRNGCDTRNDILTRDLTERTYKAGTHDCVVLTGVLVDPYGGGTIAFQRGQTTSTAVQIDHVVALSDAWQKGAQQLSADERRELANDPLNLLASDGPLNMSKGDGDTATWLPPNKAFRCTYVARQVAVKQSYDLWVTTAERDAMTRVLTTCPDEPLPTSADAATITDPHATRDASVEAEDEAAPEPAEPAGGGAATSSDGSGGSVFYQNCDAVRAAGADPIRVGDPGYSTKLDRDKDGVGCE